MITIGIISDTHGSLSARALAALDGVDRILHAGDIGSPEVLDRLACIAPTTAVRGNTDGGNWCKTLPLSDMLEIRDASFYLIHDLNTLDIDPISAGIRMVIFGHTHQPANLTRDGVSYFNPGSASARRHGGPLSVGRIELIDGHIVPNIIVLDG